MTIIITSGCIIYTVVHIVTSCESLTTATSCDVLSLLMCPLSFPKFNGRHTGMWQELLPLLLIDEYKIRYSKINAYTIIRLTISQHFCEIIFVPLIPHIHATMLLQTVTVNSYLCV